MRTFTQITTIVVTFLYNGIADEIEELGDLKHYSQHNAFVIS